MGQHLGADRATRILLNAPIGVEMDDGSHVQATLLDLSSGGFRVRSDELLCVGEKVTLRMDGEEPMPGQIKWVTGFVAGGIFLVGPGPLG
jgi:hypothetical protein